MPNDKTQIERSYIDNYAIKEFVTETLVPKYFPDIDVSLRTIGMVGMTSELISNVAEDSFNATSVLFRESFPNRAEIPESIYSHASIFQLSNIFSSASECSFLLVLEEDSIIKNMIYDSTSAMYYFYIDKNTTIYVENIPYTLDYDIQIRCIKKKTPTSERYIFTASYILDEYINTISKITDPYIKVRRSSSGFIALEVSMHQVVRDVHYEPIITNSKINMPYIDINFDGQLVGFDILYKTAEETEFTKQMQKLLIYSQPITTPFCYYQLHNDNTIRITFNAKDGYFTPQFNSELRVILYISKGAEANFDVYNGSNISIKFDDSVYSYNNDIVMAASTLSGSHGGADRLNLDELQALSVEGYRTALALTTEPDLMFYFSNYELIYGDMSIKFIKRRNDVYERLFAAYCVMKYGSEIFRTNTLDMDMNLSDMSNPENNIYMIEPGTLFTYVNDSNTKVSYYRDSEKSAQYYEEYLQAIEDGSTKYEVDPNHTLPDYLVDRNISFAEFKARKGYNDNLHVFDLTEEELTALDDYINAKFMFINPFLIRFKKSPNLVTLYQTCINERSTVDFTNQNTNSFVQFVVYQVQVERGFSRDKEYTVRTSLMPSITVSGDYPVIKYMGGYDTDGNPIYNINNRYTLDQNDLRVLFVIYNNNQPVCYSEMYPESFTDNTTLKYVTKFSSDDYITTDNLLRLRTGVTYLVENADDLKVDYPNITNIENGWYFKQNDNDNTVACLYDGDDNLIQEDISIDDITNMTSLGYTRKFSKLVNMKNIHDTNIFIPMENVVCKVVTLYRRKYVEMEHYESSLVLTDHEDTNNPFIVYDGTAANDYRDSTYDTYVWTNEYSTDIHPITFIKPLNHVRSGLYFEDFTEKDDEGNFIHDVMDVRMESIPFVRWNLAYDEKSMSTFMTMFQSQYENISSIISTKLRNETSIDLKLYNTYGRSENYYIGEQEEPLNTLNLRIALDMWFIQGTDTTAVLPEIKQFIKDRIETISDNGTNQIHASNLMREIEHNFTYVDHIRFRGFNDYDSSYQSIKLKYNDENEMTKEERRKYVPELLVIDLNDIIITEYEAT